MRRGGRYTVSRNESFFQFRLEAGSSTAQVIRLEFYLVRVKALADVPYERLWVEATGPSLQELLDSNSRSMPRKRVEALAMETLKYSCKLRGSDSPWLLLTPSQLLQQVISFTNSNLGSMSDNVLIRTGLVPYKPPPEILTLMPVRRPTSAPAARSTAAQTAKKQVACLGHYPRRRPMDVFDHNAAYRWRYNTVLRKQLQMRQERRARSSSSSDGTVC